MIGFNIFKSNIHYKYHVFEQFIFNSSPDKSVFQPFLEISSRFCGESLPAGMFRQFSVAESYF
jgi:hypothetical protein